MSGPLIWVTPPFSSRLTLERSQPILWATCAGVRSAFIRMSLSSSPSWIRRTIGVAVIVLPVCADGPSPHRVQVPHDAVKTPAVAMSQCKSTRSGIPHVTL